MKKIIYILIILVSLPVLSQVGVGTTTPNANAILDVTSTEKGFLPPRMTNAEVIDLAVKLSGTNLAEDKGMIVYDTDSNALLIWNGTAFLPLSTKDNYYASSYLGVSGTMLTSLSGGKVLGESELSNFKGFGSVTGETELIYAGSKRVFLMNVTISFRPENTSSGYKTFEFYVVKRNSGGTQEIVGSSVRSTLDLSALDSQIATITTSIELDPLDQIEIHVKGNNESIIIENLQINLW